jgi:hypothetical protein
MTSMAALAIRAVLNADPDELASIRDAYAGTLSSAADELDQPAPAAEWRDRALLAGHYFSTTLSILEGLRHGTITLDEALELAAKISEQIHKLAAQEVAAMVDQQLEREAQERRQ